MKQCPKCKQLFPQEMLKFCRSDGSQLVSITAFLEEAPTMMISPGQITDRSPQLFPDRTSPPRRAFEWLETAFAEDDED